MQFAGVQHQTRRLFCSRKQQTAVQIAAQNRVAKPLAVDTQLMGAAGFRRQLDPRHRHATLIAQALNHPIGGIVVSW